MTTKRMTTKRTTMIMAKRTTKTTTAMIPHKGDGKYNKGKPHTKGKFSKDNNPFFFKVVVEGQFVVAGKRPVYSTTSPRPPP